MRPKSLEKFKTKVREITRRCNNLDMRVFEKLNQVIRGTANYFATDFSTCVKLYHEEVVVMTPHSIRGLDFGRRAAEEAMKRGSPGAGKPHAGKCRESTLPRQRGGGGWNTLQPPLYPLRIQTNDAGILTNFAPDKCNAILRIRLSYPKSPLK